jgi:hypothetical protein
MKQLGYRRMTSNRLAIATALILMLPSAFRPPRFAAQELPKHELDRWLRAAADFETQQTEKLLGVPVQNFPRPQGLSGYDDLPPNRRPLRFGLTERSPKLPPPQAPYEIRSIVKAQAPDGSIYEAYSTRDEDELTPNHGFASTYENRRQMYGTHHGYEFSPENVYIGRRVNGLLKPQLFFRDIGSHDTAPHHFAIDKKGMVYLAVADVNIFQENRLDFYAVIGDPATGRWTSAWLIDRRGFTSRSRPWTAAWGDTVNFLWNWCDESFHKNAPGMGIFHLEWTPSGWGRKVRVVKGVPRAWEAAIDARSGRVLLVYSNSRGVYVTSRPEGGSWSRPTLLRSGLEGNVAVSVVGTEDGTFIIGTDEFEPREWVLRVRAQTTNVGRAN